MADGSPHIPTVSIVMPVYNEAGFIVQSLTALTNQTYDLSKMEIIVADGCSSDGTRRIVKLFEKSSPVRIKLIDNDKRIAPTGLNRAISAAVGEIIIRIDGHCEVDSNYVSHCVLRLQSGLAEAVGGPIETIGETAKAKAIAAAMGSRFGVGNSAFRTGSNRELYVDTVAFPGYRRAIFDRVGLFNEELVRNQDDEFNYRLRKLGGRILLAPEIRARYFSRSTFASVWRQYYQYGFWKVRVFQLHPAQMSPRQFVPLLFVISIGALTITSLFVSLSQLLLVSIVGVYFVAAMVAAIHATRPFKALMVPYVAFTFMILHSSYGLGFLKGLVVFRNRWGTRPKSLAITTNDV